MPASSCARAPASHSPLAAASNPLLPMPFKCPFNPTLLQGYAIKKSSASGTATALDSFNPHAH